MNFTEEEYNYIKTELLEEIKRIIINSSYSSLSVKLENYMDVNLSRFDFGVCHTCNTGRFLAIHRLYDMWLDDYKKYVEANEKTAEAGSGAVSTGSTAKSKTKKNKCSSC